MKYSDGSVLKDTTTKIINRKNIVIEIDDFDTLKPQKLKGSETTKNLRSSDRIVLTL